MRMRYAMLIMVGLVSSFSIPAFAIKQLNDKFTALYVEAKDANPELKTLSKEAKCNVCHIQMENKKKRNPFGEALHKAIEEAKFPTKDFGKDPTNAKYADQVKDIFKKVVEQKAAGTDKTFAERMKAGQLPGGDKEGKGLQVK